MAAPLLAAGAAAGAGLLGQAFNAYSTGKMNKRAENFAWRMHAQQRADHWQDLHYANSYNDPSAQMQRLDNAGLNPHLVYGHGQATEPSAPSRGANVSAPNFKAPQVDAGSVVFNALQAKQLQSNIARTDAETQAIRSRTIDQDFKNSVNQKIGAENMAYRYNVELNRLSQQQKVELSRYQSEITAAGDPHDSNSPAAKAKRAGFDLAVQELQNATSRGDALASEAAIKAYEKRLTDQGFSPNSPYYLKAILTLLEKVGLGVNNLTD